MTRALAVLSQALHSLVDQSDVLLVDVESQQPQSPGGAATDAVQELKSLTHQIIIVFVVLIAQEVLENDKKKWENINRLILSKAGRMEITSSKVCALMRVNKTISWKIIYTSLVFKYFLI